MLKIKLCGCGQPTKKIIKTINKQNKIKGEYNKFIYGHNLKILKKSEEHKRKIGEGNFRGGRILRHGYIYVYVKNHPYAKKFCNTYYYPEHRLIMEKHLGRYLKQKEVVHHINGNIKNNVISNLLLLPNQSAHAKFHHALNGNHKLKQEV